MWLRNKREIRAHVIKHILAVFHVQLLNNVFESDIELQCFGYVNNKDVIDCSVCVSLWPTESFLWWLSSMKSMLSLNTDSVLSRFSLCCHLMEIMKIPHTSWNRCFSLGKKKHYSLPAEPWSNPSISSPNNNNHNNNHNSNNNNNKFFFLINICQMSK